MKSFFIEQDLMLFQTCIFGGHNLRYIKDTYNQILQIYEENTDELSSLKYSSAALLEQGLFFPKYLSLLFEEVCIKKMDK